MDQGNLTIVHVIWIDAEARASWSEVSEVADPPSDTHSVGIKIHEDSDFICVAVTYDPATKTCNAIMKIPQVCVKKVRVLCRVRMKS